MTSSQTVQSSADMDTTVIDTITTRDTAPVFTLYYHDPDEHSDFARESFRRVCDLRSAADVRVLFSPEYFTADWFRRGFYMLVRQPRSPVIADNPDCNRISFVSFIENRRTGAHSGFRVWRSLVEGLVAGTLLSPRLRTPATNAVVVKSTPKANGKVTFNIWLPSCASYMDPREAISSEFHSKICGDIQAYSGKIYRDQNIRERSEQDRRDRAAAAESDASAPPAAPAEQPAVPPATDHDRDRDRDRRPRQPRRRSSDGDGDGNAGDDNNDDGWITQGAGGSRRRRGGGGGNRRNRRPVAGNSFRG